MEIARPPGSAAASLLFVLAALIALVSGPSAAVHSAADRGSVPHIEGMSPHGDDATTRTTNRRTPGADDLTSAPAVETRRASLLGQDLSEIRVASDAVLPTWAVAASPGSGRSPPPVDPRL